MTTPNEAAHGDLRVFDAADLIDELAEVARAADGTPTALAEGAFAMYPMADGGMMFVTSVEQGPLAGIKHARISPGLIRAISTLASGGSKFQALKMLGGFGRRKEITDGGE